MQKEFAVDEIVYVHNKGIEHRRAKILDVSEVENEINGEIHKEIIYSIELYSWADNRLCGVIVNAPQSDLRKIEKYD